MLMVDLGGGSCELTISNGGHIRETVSLPLGAVRLTNEFFHHDPPRKAGIAAPARIYRSRNRQDCGRIARARPRLVLATSGTAARSSGCLPCPLQNQGSARRC